MHSSPAHAQRCAVICDAIGIPRCDGAEFVRSVCANGSQANNALQDELHDSRIAYLLYAAFLGRSPNDQEIRSLGLSLQSRDAAEIADSFFRSKDYQHAEASGLTLFCPPPEALILDVTHTALYRHTSGIQRVVRSLSNALASHEERPFFVQYCGASGRFLLLTQQEIATMVAPRLAASRKPARQSEFRRWLASTKASFKRLAGKRVARAASLAMRQARLAGRMCRRIVRPILSATTSRAAMALRPRRQTGVFLWHQHLLIPELAADEQRIELLKLVLSATPVRSTLILYDLIPIRHPDCFPAKSLSGYLLYLTLLRHIDAISCISATVRDDVLAFLPLVPRSKPGPRIDYHYLGADFCVTDEPGQLLAGHASPFVLCVGTIEPRKNQTRILAAMAQAQLRGCDFTGVFVGNAGWLNGHFRLYLRQMQDKGCRILLFEHASDADLERLYNASAFTVYCSIAEGFGLPIIESVMRGKACITSNVGSMKEIADQLGGCLLVNPTCVDDISDAIQRLVREPHSLATLQRAADAATWTNWQDYAAALRSFCTTAPTRPQAATHEVLTGPKRTSYHATPGETLP